MGVSIERVVQHMQGAGAATVATLNQHCQAVYPGVASNRFSPVRGVLRQVGMGALANGASRYPALPGAAYAAALQAAQAGCSPDATLHAAAQAMARVQRTVWQAKGTPQAAQERTAQRVAKAKAAAAQGGKAAKQQGKVRKATQGTPAPAPAPATPAPEPTTQPAPDFAAHGAQATS